MESQWWMQPEYVSYKEYKCQTLSHTHSHMHIHDTAEVFLTAYQSIVLNGRFKDGETILIHAVRFVCALVHSVSSRKRLNHHVITLHYI